MRSLLSQFGRQIDVFLPGKDEQSGEKHTFFTVEYIGTPEKTRPFRIKMNLGRGGVYGEVVFTILTRRGMPLIRYRMSDRSRFLPGVCPCGAELRTLEKASECLRGVFN